jgi:hypothetical protein
MPYGSLETPATVLWALTVPVTVAASPLTSPWFNMDGVGQVYVISVAVGGTTALTLEWSFDGSTVDSDITPTSVAVSLAMTARDVLAPFMRVKWTQTTANATTSKLVLRAR